MRGKRLSLLKIIFMFAALFGLMWASIVSAQAPETNFSPEVETIFEKLSPAERVGQLFLVTYDGVYTQENSLVARLIRDYRVGGIQLQYENKPTLLSDNPDTQDSRLLLQDNINQLQSLTFQKRQTQIVTITNIISNSGTITPSDAVTQATELPTTPIPLFIAIEHGGNGYPYEPFSPEIPDTPSGMALGATWNLDYANQVGQILGQELSNVGVNMFLGPSLDVLDKPSAESAGSGYVQSFGGDPYWVSRFARAYIGGLHQGSQGQILAVVNHFPGAGSIDRTLNQDIPTIQKFLGQLQLLELAPFSAVTTMATDPLQVTDGLMTAHIRYRGLQGNIRDLTKPISLDPQNLPQILETLSPWRQSGGLVLSGPLGVPAIVKTYKATDGDFPARRIALDAFLAGSDLLLVSDFAVTDDPQQQFDNIVTTIEFFQDKYETDPVFQQQVDLSVHRILQAKLKIYKNFQQYTILRQPDIFENAPTTTDILFDVARDGVTLVYPSLDELADRVPSPPLPDENIIIFSDDRQSKMCDECSPFYQLPPDALQKAILNRYGPTASGQINSEQIASYTFSDLVNMLEDNPESSTRNIVIKQHLSRANWIIFAMLDVDTTQYPKSDAVKRFLREDTTDLRDKKVIAMAFDAPVYLDNTEVSVLTVYYSFYNKTLQYIEAAAQLLFQEFSPQGYAPINIDAVEYSITKALEPDPEQVIALDYAIATQDEPTEDTTPVVEASPTVDTSVEGTPQAVEVSIGVGDKLLIMTGVILDKLGNPVPDNTLVAFNSVYPQEGLVLAPIIASTVDGVAQTIITVDREGSLEITASSGDATRSGKIIVAGPNITIETPMPTPTSVPTETPTATPTVTPFPTATAAPTVTVEPIPTLEPVIPETETQPNTLISWDLILSLIALIGLATIIALRFTETTDPIEIRIYPALLVVAVGLVGYVLYGIFAVQLSAVKGVGDLVRQNTTLHWVTPFISVLFGLLGWGGLCLIHRMQASGKEEKSS